MHGMPVGRAIGWIPRLAGRSRCWAGTAALVPAILLMSCAARQPQEPPAATGPVEPAAAAVAADNPVSARSVPAGQDDVESAEVEPRPQLRIETGAHSAFVRRIAVAAHADSVVTASDDKTARVWNLATGELRQVLRPAIGRGEIGRLYGVATHPREDLVAVGGTTGARAGEHRILLHSIGSGALVRAFDARGGDIRKLAWSTDGSVLLAVYAGEHALRAFDASGVLLHEQPLAAPSYGLAVAADGTVAASSFDGQVVVVRAGERRVTAAHSFRTRTAEPVGLAFSPDGARLVVGFRTAEQPPEVYEAATGRYLFKLARPPVQAGSHRTVAWSDDGKTIAVGGSGYNRQHKFPVFFHDAASGRLVAQQEVGNDTIYDLVALPGTRFAYASGDGSWGVVGPDRIERSVQAAIADLKGAGNLQVDATGRRVGWTHAWGREPASFDFTRRIVATGSAAAAGDLLAPKARRGLFDDSVWENAVSPSLNGRPVPLGLAEVSRAVAYFRNGRGAVLGTSHRLMRLDDDNRVSWEVRNADEVRSVNITGDERMIVTGMSDGTLRWWRAADGKPLMSLLATRDKRWVAWTPEGYFDASAGADRLVGWTVNRGTEPVADHFSLNRFRERFNRPDLIDEVLRTATPVAALDPAIITRVARTTPPSLQFPPVVSPINLGSVEVAERQLKVPVEVRADHQVRLEVRVDGRPVEADIAAAPAAGGGTAALASLPRPAPGSIVQVIAQDQNGISEPAGFFVDPGSGAAAADSIPTRSSQQQAGLYVLAIGISEYQRREYKLGFAAKDARDFADAMVSQRGRLYRQVQARTLVDKQATLPGILAGLEWLTDHVKAGDIGMLFLAGHGMNSASGQYYFLPHEGNHRQLAETGLPESAIRDTLGRMRGKALFFVDTCYGGNVVGTPSRELARLANDLAATENGVVVFASSSGRQLSEENTAWGNGAFTKAVLAGLAGEADLTNTGRITFKGLDFYISEEVNKLTAGRQTPVTISPLGVPDFAIARVGD